MARFAVILPAAGRSSRFGDKEKKPFVPLDGRAVWLRTAELFLKRDDVCQCVLVISPADDETFRRRYGANVALMDIKVVHGGDERFESVAKALEQVRSDADFVAVHDAVRPCVRNAQLDAVFRKAEETGAALLAVPVTDTLKRVDGDGRVCGTVSREGLWHAQTPQVFRRAWLVDAYARRSELGSTITDDAQLIEAAGHPVSVVEGSAGNLKITTKADLALAEAILRSEPDLAGPAEPNRPRPAHPFAEDDMWGGR